MAKHKKVVKSTTEETTLTTRTWPDLPEKIEMIPVDENTAQRLSEQIEDGQVLDMIYGSANEDQAESPEGYTRQDAFGYEAADEPPVSSVDEKTNTTGTTPPPLREAFIPTVWLDKPLVAGPLDEGGDAGDDEEDTTLPIFDVRSTFVPPILSPPDFIITKAKSSEPVKNNGAAFAGPSQKHVSSRGRNIVKAREDRGVKNV